MKIYPVFIPQAGCEFRCVYCNQFAITNTNKLNYEKVKADIKAFCSKHKNEQKEIAFFGGTFTNLTVEKRKFYYNLCKPFLNEKTFIRFSTHPNCINKKLLEEAKNNGVKTIELGVQSFNNIELKKTKRNYTFFKVAKSCLLVKKYGFNLGIQLMPGMPSQTINSFLQTIFYTVKLKPAFVRIYPMIVLANTAIEKLYKNNEYKPLSIDETINWVYKAVLILNASKIEIAKIGLHGDIIASNVVAGPYCPRFGEILKAKMLKQEVLNSYKNNKILNISNKDVSLFLGDGKKMLNSLKKELKVSRIKVNISNNLKKGDFFYSNFGNEHKTW